MRSRRETLRRRAANRRWYEKNRARAAKKHSPEQRAFYDAKLRCTNPRTRDWKHYGARGIEFRFRSFREFLAEIGPRPEGRSLDRIDNEGHYEPGNVRWATPRQQALNKRRARFLWHAEVLVVKCATRKCRARFRQKSGAHKYCRDCSARRIRNRGRAFREKLRRVNERS